MKYIAAVILITLNQSLIAEEAPSNWGFGVGIGAINYPHYLGADQSELLIAPFPRIEYYGERFTLDDEGLAAKIFNSDRINLQVSLSASLPVSSDDNDAREGMDDLELLLGVGPALEITLRKWENSILRVDLPIRAALELDFSGLPDYAGWVFDPKLHYELSKGNWAWEFEAGGLFGSEDYHELYYEVAPEFATSERQAYQAERGFTGLRSSLGTKYSYGQWQYLGYVRYLNFSSAANRESPLLVQNDYVSFGVGVSWMFRDSKKRTNNSE